MNSKDYIEYLALKQLYKQEAIIYEEFATESLDNIHVKSINVNVPLASILRVILSDIVSSQIYTGKNLSDFNFRILPVKLHIYDRLTSTCSNIVLNEKKDQLFNYIIADKDIDKIVSNFRNELFEKKLLDTIAEDYAFQDDTFDIQNYKTKSNENNFFSHTYDNSEFEKRKNQLVNYDVEIHFELYRKTDCGSFQKIDEINYEEDAIIRPFLKKLIVLAISTKRNKDFFVRIRNKSLKSSLAAVMSRNMSHNIGSHVLNKMSSTKNVNEFFKIDNESIGFVSRHNAEDEEQNYFTTENDEPVYYLHLKPEDQNLKTPELSRIFNNYLKQRMDFVADVATSTRAALSNSKYLKADLFRSFERNLLLLNNISGKGKGFPYTFDFKYFNREGKEEENVDPIVSTPNDVLGDQAFYILLENIIRNTAKHSPKKENNLTTFTIKIEDAFDDFFKITVYDDIKIDNKNELLKLIAERNNNIAEEVLDPNTNDIRSSGWGTIEMKLACCYLNRISTTNIDNDEYKPLGLHLSKNIDDLSNFKYKEYDNFIHCNKDHTIRAHKNWQENPAKFYRFKTQRKFLPLLQATQGCDKSETSGFGYSFLLKKPKEVLIYDPNHCLEKFLQDHKEEDKKNNWRRNLRQLGIDIVDKLSRKTIYVHNYFIVIQEDIKDYNDWYNLPQEMCSVHTEDDKLKLYEYYDFYCEKDNKQNQKKHEQDCLFDILKKCIDVSSVEPLNFIINYLYFKSGKKKYFDLDFGTSGDLGTQFVQIIKDNLSESDVIAELQNNDIEYPTAKFEHHGIEKQTFNTNIVSNNYVELYGSSTRLGFYFQSLSKEIESNFENDSLHNALALNVYNFLFRGANTNVAIIDERVQSVLNDIAFTAENKDGIEGDFNYSYEEIFDGIGISVPKNNDINLNQTGLSNKKEYLFDWIEKTISKCHYLIIHFGIIESLRTAEDGYNDIYKVTDKIRSYCKNKKCKLVITSGRGFTKDVASLNEYFLSYSTLSNLVLDKNNRSKSHLVKVLNALRNKQKEKI